MHRRYHTPLSDWMRQTGTTAPALAQQLGVTRTAVYQWASGRLTPSAAHLVALVGVTGLPVTSIVSPPVGGTDADHPA